jgi:hypothetical protein
LRKTTTSHDRHAAAKPATWLAATIGIEMSLNEDSVSAGPATTHKVSPSPGPWIAPCDPFQDSLDSMQGIALGMVLGLGGWLAILSAARSLL